MQRKQTNATRRNKNENEKGDREDNNNDENDRTKQHPSPVITGANVPGPFFSFFQPFSFPVFSCLFPFSTVFVLFVFLSLVTRFVKC